MKKQTTAAVIAAAMLFVTAVFAADNTNTENTVSETAATITAAQTDSIANAKSRGIFDNADYDPAGIITREKFCEFAYNMLNSVKELPAPELSESQFDDTANYKINSLSFVNIINGKDTRIFAPEDNVTREEAAVILYRCAEYAGLELPMVKVDINAADNSEISDWAVPYIYSIKVPGIINDINGLFKPQAEYTFGETAASLVKLQDLIKNSVKN